MVGRAFLPTGKVGMYFCGWCKENKQANAFYTSNPRKCKECVKKAVKDYADRNPDKIQKLEQKRAFLPKRISLRDEYAKSDAYKASHSAAQKKWRTENPEKYKAQTALNNALKRGLVDKPDQCTCGGTHKMHAHHEDYSKPLEVKWLCSKCHEIEHHSERTRFNQESAA